MKTPHWPGPLLAAFLLLASGACAADAKVLRDEWFTLHMMGVRVGYAHERTVEETVGVGVLRTSTSRTRMRLVRMGRVTEVEESSSVTETAEGLLVRFRYESLQSRLRLVTEGRRRGGEMEWTTRVGEGKATTRSRPLDREVLCPWQAELAVRAGGLSPGTALELRLFLPSSPDRYGLARYRVGGVEAVTLPGGPKPLHRVSQTLLVGRTPVLSETWVDADWRVHRVRSMGTLDLYRTSREEALRPPPDREVYLRTVVPSSRPIERPRSVRSLLLRLELSGGAMPPIPQGGRQSVLESGEGFRVVRVQVAEPDPDVRRPVEGPGLGPYLEASPYLQKDDEAVASAARRVAGDETSALRAARKLEAWVHRAVRIKSFGVGFATAAEVMRDREGDCSEHAVLLAALCRAAGIPSRVAAGVLYDETLRGDGPAEKGGFAFHMWTEVYAGAWVALDATLGLGFADATHLALARSALASESALYDIVPVTAYLGRLRITVLD